MKRKTDPRPERQGAKREPVQRVRKEVSPLPSGHEVLHLHKKTGNQALQKLFRSGAIQAKLKIGAPSNAREQEADRVAEQVLRMPDTAISGPRRASSKENVSLQMKPGSGKRNPSCGDREIKTKSTGATPAVGPDVQDSKGGSHMAADTDFANGGGRPMPKETREFFEPRLGHDFSRVRLHTDEAAGQAASALGARAFTLGEHIGFGYGEYSPDTEQGKRLLGHELTHVVQQRGEAKNSLLRKIAADELPKKKASEIMSDETYIDNNIEKVEFYYAELAIINYKDGTKLRLGLVPDAIQPPVEGVDYRRDRSEHATVETTETGVFKFIPNARNLKTPAGMPWTEAVKQAQETASFKVDPASSKIVPTLVNSLTAPVLCGVLRTAEKEYSANMDEISKAGVKIFKAFEKVLMIYSLLPGAGLARGALGRGAAAGSAAAIASRAETSLLKEFLAILKSGVSKELITVEGVQFFKVRVVQSGTELLITRFGIRKIVEDAARGRLVQGAFERAAIAAARQAGAKSVRIAMEMPVNEAWKMYLVSQGYAMQIVEVVAGRQWSNLLTKVITL